MSERPENRAVELHDSTVGYVDTRNGRIEIGLMPAYVHSSAGEPGVDPGTGWLQNVAIVVEGGNVEGELPQMPCDLSGGTLAVAETVSDNTLTLPLDQSGSIELKLEVMWGGQIVVRGTRILTILKGEPKYVEDFK